jgi:vitamin B12 transporter
VAVTTAQGFRAPTFNDLYLVAYRPVYTPNPDLRPERSRSREVSLRSAPRPGLQWRVTGFDNRLQDLIVATASTVMNVNRARVRGIETEASLDWIGIRWRAAFTVQRPRDEDTGSRLQGRARQFGSLHASRSMGAWTVGASVVASGDRFDSLDEAPSTRLGGYARVDARVRYAIDKRWAVEVTAINLGDKRYEHALGYEGARRGALLSVRFDAF